MSGKLVPKLRIVKCPKCRQLLQEPQGYDVYKCGGCGTDLQAKKQTMAVKSDSSIQEIKAAPGNALHSDKKRRFPLRKDSLKAKETASSRECYLDGNSENNGGQLVPFKFTDEEELESEFDIPKLSLRRHRVSKKVGSIKTTHCENEEISNGDFSLERPEEESVFSSDVDENNDKSALVRDIPKFEIAEINLGNLSLEEAGAELISRSGEANVNIEKSATEGASPEVEVMASDLEGVVVDLNNGNLPLEELNSGIHGGDIVGENLDEEITGNNIAEEKLYNGIWTREGAERDLNVCASDKEEPENEKSAVEDAKSEVDTAEATTTKNPSTENVDTLDTTEQRDHSSELSNAHGKEKLSESPTTRSSNAYDDGLSPQDGINERFPIQHLDSLKNTYTVAEERIRKGKGPANGDFGTQHQSNVPEEKNHMVKDSRRNKKEVLDNTSHGDSGFMKTRDHEFLSRIPFHRNGYQSHNESGMPSNGMHDESSSFLSRDPHEDTDQEKMKLLGMIYKLQDELNKTRYVSEKSNGRVATGVSYKENHNSVYKRHSHDLHEGRFSHALDHSRCNGRCHHEITSHQRHKYSRIPYSAEATSWAYRVDHPCHHCCSHVSADLSPRVHFQHEDLHRCCRAHDCCSSGPQYFTASKLPLYSSETNSDDQRYRATIMRKYLREKRNLAKQHHRPVAGGAPFVTCPKCFKLLQLPADFLFKKACHQLKCGGCSEVLKFSLKDGTHVVPFSSIPIGLPSRELHHGNEVICGGKLPSKTHVNHHHYSPAKPISYYDDYGLSVSQSFSSEVDPAFLTQQFHPLHSSEYVNPGVSPSSTFKAKIIGSRYFSTIAAPMETDESMELFSSMPEPRKLSSEKEAWPPRKSALHKLMGYATPSKVIKGTPY